MKLITTHTPYDIKTLITEAVIESHLRVTFSDDSAYLDALVGAAWDHVENFIGVKHGAGTITFESERIESNFMLPLDAQRKDTLSVTYWDGDSYEAATTVHSSGIGYPTTFTVDSTDDVFKNASTSDALILTKGTVTITEVTPSNSIQQAFLIYLGFLYENRESVITGAISTTMPAGFQNLLRPYKKYTLG